MRLPDIDQFMKFTFLSRPRWAPDGSALAFIAAQAEEERYRPVLWLSRSDGSLLRLAETAPGSLCAWEEEGTLLFAARRDPGEEARREQGEAFTSLYRISPAGGEAQKAFEIGLAVESLRHLGGSAYLVLGLYDRDCPQLEGLSEGEKTAALKERKEERDYQVMDELPFWFNGEGFTNGRRRRLYLFDAAKNTLAPISPQRGEVSHFCVSPCKTRVAYALKEYDSVQPLHGELREWDIFSGSERRRTPGIYHIHALDYWKGDVVLAAATGEERGLNENPRLCLWEEASGAVTPFAFPDATVGASINTDCRLGGGNTFQVWGDALYYTSLRGFRCRLYRMELPGGREECLTPEADSVDCFDAGGPDIRLIAFVGQGLPELYALEGKGLRQLSAFHEEERELWKAPPVHHSFERDGFVIDGWALLPHGYDANRKYPAILNIHGGPETAYGEIYFHEMQYWAAQGYFVFFCNPRGSDGKGSAFMDIRGKYGQGDYEDLMMFVDEMLRRYPAVDPARVGVAGGSYGGFMTNWIIGHTGRFAAAASQRCISNWLSFAGSSDIGFSFATDQMGADTWSDPEALWRHSPLKYADQATTPTLFIHSDEDYRCWVPEALQMFHALKLHGVESRICLFHGENHELSRSGKPKHRIRRLREITSWMDRYLKPTGGDRARP